MSGYQALPSQPRDEDGPVFNEPWEAQAFALAVELSQQGQDAAGAVDILHVVEGG